MTLLRWPHVLLRLIAQLAATAVSAVEHARSAGTMPGDEADKALEQLARDLEDVLLAIRARKVHPPRGSS